MGASLAERVRLAVRLCKVRRGRRTAARGVSAPAGGLSSGMHPPFLFCLAKRETGRARSKEKSVGALRCSGPPRDGGRRIGASADLGWPSGTLWPSAKLILPSRGRWCGGQRGARTHLSCFSFRAFRFATRCLGGRGGLYRRADEGIRPYGITAGLPRPVGADALIGPLRQLPSTTGQRQRKPAQNVSQTSPGWRFPQG